MQGQQQTRSPLTRILVNVAFITGSTILGRILNLVLHAALGRLFGPEGLGGYATAVAVAGYFIFVVDLGLSPRLVREGAVSPERLEEEYARALGLKAMSAVLALAGLLGLCLLLPYDPWVQQLCFLMGCSSIISSFSYLNQSVCRCRERLDLEGAATVFQAVAFVGSSLVCFVLGFPVAVVGYTSVAAACLHLLVSAIFARRFVRISLRLPPEWSTLRLAVPYATTSLTLLAFAQIDVLIVSITQTQEFVGRYASVARLLAMAGTFGALAGVGVLPTASRIYASASTDRFRDLVNEALRVVVLLGGGATLGLATIAKPAIATIYGPAFADLYPILQAGSIFLVFKFSVSVLAIVLTSCGRQGDRARSVLLGLLATVVLVLALVPLFGIPGAVAAMVGSEVFLLLCFFWYLRDFLAFSQVAKTFATLGVSIPIAGWVHLQLAVETGWLPALTAVVVPLLLYAAIVFLSGEARTALRFVIGLRRGQRAVST